MTGDDDRRRTDGGAGASTPTPAGRPARRPGVLTRRKLVLGSALGLAAAGGGAGTYAWFAERDQGGRVQALGGGPRMGAMVSAPADEGEVARWRADVDTLAEYRQNIVRTGIYAWKVAPEPERWDPAAASFYRSQLEYARSAGLQVNLVLPGAPDWAQSYGWDEYVAACTWFWTRMRESFGDLVALWQPFNEADHAHYQLFTPATRDATYLGELSRLLERARDILGEDGVPVTTNLTGWPMNDEREQEWYLVLDAIAAPLDVISIDLYPADNEEEIRRVSDRMERVKQRYGKPVFVAELGLQTTPDSWTEPEQQRYVAAAIDQLRTVELWGICLYELRDTESQPGFGIKRSDGSHKQGFADVMRALDPA